MLKLFQNNVLIVIDINANGAYVDGGKHGLLRLIEAPEGLEKGEKVDTFLYREPSGEVMATMADGQTQVGECAYLKVVATGDHGAFLDWGLAKDLLLPLSEQAFPVSIGRYYVVHVYYDKSERPIASSILHRYLSESQGDLNVGDSVDLLIAGESELGFKAVINHQQLGLIYDDELSQPLHVGSRIKGWVKGIRDDGKIDLNINTLDRETRDQLESDILDQLKQAGGRIELSDKSSPVAIFRVFKVSKKNFKRALGSLYKQRIIKISADYIELI